MANLFAEHLKTADLLLERGHLVIRQHLTDGAELSKREAKVVLYLTEGRHVECVHDPHGVRRVFLNHFLQLGVAHERSVLLLDLRQTFSQFVRPSPTLLMGELPPVEQR